jgi:ABC-type cobalamin/Fe3+-siderophores transport system ATPase subunit
VADIETVSRKDFLREFSRDYHSGQHLTALGPTGRGKTYLIRQCLKRVCSPELQVISLHGKIKGRDPVVAAMGKDLNLRVVPSLPSAQRQKYDRKVRKHNGYLLIPLEKPNGDPAEEDRVLRQEFKRALEQNYRTRKRPTITHVNEAHQVQEELKLKKACEATLMRGAPDNAMWSEAQRGRWLSWHTYEAPEHMFVFYDDVREERKRYADFGCADPDEIEWITSQLRTERVADGRTISQCLYIRRGGGMFVIDT